MCGALSDFKFDSKVGPFDNQENIQTMLNLPSRQIFKLLDSYRKIPPIWSRPNNLSLNSDNFNMSWRYVLLQVKLHIICSVFYEGRLTGQRQGKHCKTQLTMVYNMKLYEIEIYFKSISRLTQHYYRNLGEARLGILVILYEVTWQQTPFKYAPTKFQCLSKDLL